MARFTVQASNSMGAIGGLSDYEVTEALKVAIGYRDQGFSRITLRDVDTGAEVELDRFVQNQGNA